MEKRVNDFFKQWIEGVEGLYGEGVYGKGLDKVYVKRVRNALDFYERYIKESYPELQVRSGSTLGAVAVTGSFLYTINSWIYMCMGMVRVPEAREWRGEEAITRSIVNYWISFFVMWNGYFLWDYYGSTLRTPRRLKEIGGKDEAKLKAFIGEVLRGKGWDEIHKEIDEMNLGRRYDTEWRRFKEKTDLIQELMNLIKNKEEREVGCESIKQVGVSWEEVKEENLKGLTVGIMGLVVGVIVFQVLVLFRYWVWDLRSMVFREGDQR